MFHRSWLALAFALILVLVSTSAQQTIPDTPAGHTFKAWLDAFNSGDRALLDAYIHKFEPNKSLDNEMQFRKMTGGFVLLQIMKNEPLRLEFVVKEQHSETNAIGKLSPYRREEELHRGKRSDDEADQEPFRAKIFRVAGQQRQDDAEADQVNEHRQENNQNGRLPHA